jgi:very-short-patch-repair endonuclease
LPEGTRIEPQQEAAQHDGEETNTWEKRLENMVLSEWGFHGFTSQFEVELPHVSSRTIPDLAHPAARIAIYLDGPVHDEEKTKLRDRFLRNELQGLDPRWEVVELRIQDFENDRFMESIKTRISRILERTVSE